MSKPGTFLNWTDGSGSKVVQPPSSQQASGWTAGEPPPFQYMNWLFWLTDQWIQWLSGNTTTIAFQNLTANTTIPNTANIGTYFCNPDTIAPFTATLPAVAANPGLMVVIKNTGLPSNNNNVTVAANGADTIEGAATVSVTPRTSYILQNDGVTTWWQLGT